MIRNPLRLMIRNRLVFMGHSLTSRFPRSVRCSTPGMRSLECLLSLIAAPVEDRRLSAPPVKEFAESRDLAVFQPASLREDAEARQRISDLAPDAMVVAAYGLFLPEETLAAPRLGCLNIHPSLLPRHRGPSPVATAILEGDETTGVTIMLLDEGMDTGPILNQSETPIGADETCDQLTARLFDVWREPA